MPFGVQLVYMHKAGYFEMSIILFYCDSFKVSRRVQGKYGSLPNGWDKEYNQKGLQPSALCRFLFTLPLLFLFCVFLSLSLFSLSSLSFSL